MALNGIGYAILPGITLHGVSEDLNKIPLLNENNEPIGRDTWLLGYSTAFKLKQVNAFVEVLKEFLHE
jgi:DNA-binding transcriptional LysR family regulator